MKGGIVIIPITKNERFALEKMGIRIGENGILKNSVPKRRGYKYYLTENRHNLEKLEKYRKKITKEKCNG